MLDIDRILVPVDLTDASADTLRYGVAWAELFGSEVHVLHVVPDALQHAVGVDVLALPALAITEDWIREASAALTKLVASLPIAPEQVRKNACVGQPATEIKCYAAAHDIDLIVMGTHRRSTVARIALGSVAERIVRKAPCPVVTVPPEAKAPRWLGDLRTILMPTDLGDMSTATFEYARELAVCLGSDLRVLHVAAPPRERQLTYVPPAPLVYRIKQLTGVNSDSVHTESEACRICDVESAIRIGDPASKIVEYAENVDAELIVMATHGRNAFAHMVLGSVTSKVLRKAHCPVLTLSASACKGVYEPAPVVSEGLLIPA
jgi:nucleotide-binding universal stress UspA family protein